MSQKHSFVCATLGLLLALVLTFAVSPSPVAAQSGSASQAQLADFDSFARSVTNGQASSVRGIYAPGQLAFPIVQQPTNNPGYVSPVNNVVTQFGLAQQYGTVGLLAHNYLAGKSFSNLVTGQQIRIIYGDGKYTEYQVTKVYRFQALDPQNPNSDFIDQETGEKVSAASLFNRMYSGSSHLTLQTCITANGNLSWGRLFIIAEAA